MYKQGLGLRLGTPWIWAFWSPKIDVWSPEMAAWSSKMGSLVTLLSPFIPARNSWNPVELPSKTPETPTALHKLHNLGVEGQIAIGDEFLQRLEKPQRSLDT